MNAALPERAKDGKLVNIAASGAGMNHNDPGFLSKDFPRSPPKLYVTSDDDDFDDLTLAEWRNEGFNVEYLPMGSGGKEYQLKLQMLSKTGLQPCETYGIVAYGEAASFCLEHFHILDNNPDFKLCCLIAYYPTRIPDPKTRFPGGLNVLVHLTEGSDVGVIKQSQMVGIQGEKRVTQKQVERGLGAGCRLNYCWSSYSYDAENGFAEPDLDEYDKVSAELAWSRSLAMARKAFRWDVDVEAVVEDGEQSKFYTRNLQQTMSTYTTQKSPYVTYMPTLTGGIGTEELHAFYDEYFINQNPPSMKLTLVSRTIGFDRVVDELHVTFKHTQDMPWILPAVPPTNKRVEIIIVSIVALRGAKLYHEHIYWDQASVLVQTGLLDPKFVPEKAKKRGVSRLPVVGWEPARRRLDGVDDESEGEADNTLIPEDDASDEESEEEYDDANGEESGDKAQPGN